MMKVVKEENCDEAMRILESPTTLDDAYKLSLSLRYFINGTKIKRGWIFDKGKRALS